VSVLDIFDDDSVVVTVMLWSFPVTCPESRPDGAWARAVQVS
jgi:hypothetical protein